MDTDEKKKASYNPGDDVEDRFRDIAMHGLRDVDEDGNRIIDEDNKFNAIAARLRGQEDGAAGGSGDDDDDDSPASRRRLNLLKGEEAPSSKPSDNNRLSTGQGGGAKGGGPKVNLKKAAPGSVAAAVVGGGALAGFVLSPGLLLVHIKELFHNDRSDSTRTNQMFARAYLSYKFKNTGDKCGADAPKIMCKAGSMSKQEVNERRAAGFKFTGEEIDKDGNKTGKNAADLETQTPEEAAKADKDTRYQIDSMEFKADGHVSNSGSDALKHAENGKNPAALTRLMNSFNTKSKFFQNKKFAKMLTDVMKIKKGKAPTQYAEGDDDRAREQRNAQFNNATGGVSEADAEEDARRTATRASQESQDRASDGGEEDGHKRPKTKGIGSVIRTLCSGYQTVKIGTIAVQIKHYYRLVGFAMEFLKVADMIKAGAASAIAITYLMDKITYSGPYDDPAKDGLTFTDSNGFKLIAHGDMAGLKAWGERYVLGGTNSEGAAVTALLASQGIIKGLEVAMSGAVNAVKPGDDVSGRDSIKYLCRTINSKAVQIAQCGQVATALLTLGTATAPGPGSIAGATLGAVACACSLLPEPIDDAVTMNACTQTDQLAKALAAALGAALGGLIAKAAEEVIKNWDIGSDTKGVDAGDAVAAGVHQMLATTSTSYALMPTTAKKHQEFVRYTDDLTNRYQTIARADARSTPFDINNQYSFISTLAGTMKTDRFNTSPIMQSFGMLFSSIPSAVSALNNRAYAMGDNYSQPVETPAERYDCNTDKKIKNEDLAYLGVDGDKYCSVVTYTPTPELEVAKKQAEEEKNESFSEVIKYMAAKQEKNEPDGGTLDDSQGCDDQCQEDSKKPSIDKDTGKPIEKSQYSKYIAYCTDQRIANGVPWGATNVAFDAGSNRDQDWYSGKQCLKETKMMKNFRMWHILCAHMGTGDGTSSCYEDDPTASASASTCGDGTTASIYDCALQYDDYRYEWGGGHGGSAETFVKDFKSGKYAKWDHILDCSGLVRMATYEAMGADIGGGSAPSTYANNPNWKKINPDEAKKGDIIALGADDPTGHVAIIESVVGNGFKVFHATTPEDPREDNIGPGIIPKTGDGRPVAGIYRFVKAAERT